MALLKGRSSEGGSASNSQKPPADDGDSRLSRDRTPSKKDEVRLSFILRLRILLEECFVVDEYRWTTESFHNDWHQRHRMQLFLVISSLGGDGRPQTKQMF